MSFDHVFLFKYIFFCNRVALNADPYKETGEKCLVECKNDRRDVASGVEYQLT